MAQDTRVGEVDRLRGIAIIGVVGIHASLDFLPLAPVSGLTWLLASTGFFLQFAVPLFVFLSGFLLSIRYQGSYSAFRLYVKRAYSILPQYFIFSLLYLAGRNYLYGPVTAMQAVFCLLTASSSYHLWFIAVIAELYLLYPPIDRIYCRAERSSLLPYLLAALFVVQVGWNTACIALEGSGDSFAAGLLQRFFLSQVFYFVAGMYLARNPNILKGPDIKIRFLLPASALLTLAVTCLILPALFLPVFYPYIEGFTVVLYLAAEALNPLLYVLAFAMCYKLAKGIAGRGRAVLGAIGKYSFGMYLIHAAFMPFIVMALSAAGITNTGTAFYLLLFGLAVLLSYTSVYLLSFLPHSALLVGTHNEPGKATAL